MEALSDFYFQKAKLELNETEARKEQSIKQFREWLSKHPFVNKCQVDPDHLISVCRSRKYNMPKVFESFNNSIIFIHQLPQLFNFNNYQNLLEIYDKGPFLIMKNRNSDGCQILITRLKIFEDLNTNFCDLVQLGYLVLFSMTNDPKTQICGVVFIYDFTGISLNLLKIIDLKVLSKIMTLTDSMMMRIKQIVILGLPSFANVILELIKSFMSEKMKSRLKLCKNIEELVKVVNVKDLTVEYGGTDSIKDVLMQQRVKIKEQAIYEIKFYDALETDERALKIYENEKNCEGVGSFRKLEID